jgi:hypothetical protein
LIKTAPALFAQANASNLEFIENKGQWDKRVSYRVDFSSGVFFLQKQGFTVLQHNPEDIQRALDIQHGHTQSAGHAIPAKNLPTKTGPANPFVNLIHSHVYAVNFINAKEQEEIIPGKNLKTYHNQYICYLQTK